MYARKYSFCMTAHRLFYRCAVSLIVGFLFCPSATWSQQLAGDLQIPHYDAEGWTLFSPSTGSGSCGGPQATYTGTCIYYVSNTGSDDPVHCRGYAPPV